MQNPLYTLLNPKSDPCCNSKCFFLPTLWCVRCPTDGFHIWIMQWIGTVNVNRVFQNYNLSILANHFHEMYPKSNQHLSDPTSICTLRYHKGMYAVLSIQILHCFWTHPLLYISHCPIKNWVKLHWNGPAGCSNVR